MNLREIGLWSLAMGGLATAGAMDQLGTKLVTNPEAWPLWEQGRVETIESGLGKTGTAAERQEQLHLRCLCAFVSGRYEEAIGYFQQLPEAYPRLKELEGVMMEAYCHLGRYQDAQAFVDARQFPEAVKVRMDLLAQAPLTVSLKAVSEIPFVSDALTPYLPGLRVSLNGQSVVARLDTGGPFLALSPKSAKRFGLVLKRAGEGGQGGKKTAVFLGVVDEFRLGEAVMRHVPAVVLPTMEGDLDHLGDQDQVIIGTNVLEQFLSTIDYPRQRLVISPRRNPALNADHRARCAGGPETEMPFYLWGDHFMLAHGGIGAVHEGVFFVDTGLLEFMEEGGVKRQLAFQGPAGVYRKAGIAPEMIARTAFISELPLRLGALQQERPALRGDPRHTPAWPKIGGIQLDGMICHGFLSRYTWTMDFDRHQYVFSSPVEPRQ